MQNNVKSSSIAGLLGVFLGAFGGHDWYLGNTKKAVTHICLCVGGVMMLMIGLILRNLLRDIPALDLLSICVMIAAYIIIVGNGIWGFIEGVTILAQGDAGLAAKGYQVAAPAMSGVMPAQDPANAVQTTSTEPTAVPVQAASAEQTIVPDQATASPASSTAAMPAEKSAPAASEPTTNPASEPTINPTAEPAINPASESMIDPAAEPVAAKPIIDPASIDTVAAEAASANPAPAATPTATTPANPTPVTSSAPESAAITTAATPTNPESATSGTPEAPTPSL